MCTIWVGGACTWNACKPTVSRTASYSFRFHLIRSTERQQLHPSDSDTHKSCICSFSWLLHCPCSKRINQSVIQEKQNLRLVEVCRMAQASFTPEDQKARAAQHFELLSGHSIPAVGLGTWKSGSRADDAVSTAIIEVYFTFCSTYFTLVTLVSVSSSTYSVAIYVVIVDGRLHCSKWMNRYIT